MTAPFDWAGLVHDLLSVEATFGSPAASEALRTRIEAAFVPLETYGTTADVFSLKLAAATARNKVLEDAARAALTFLQSAPLESGVCCCGSAVAHHGMGDGHAPVDDLAYYAGQVADTLRAALGGEHE